MGDISYPNFETLCRLCLQTEAGQINIFPNDAGNVNQISIPVRIMACAALEVKSSDFLPKSICKECRYQLEKSYYFRKRCQLSESRLRKHLRLLSLGKKSRIFEKSEEEILEEEFELADSMDFIKNEDAEHAKKENNKFEEWKNSHKEVLRKEVEEKVRKELKSVVVEEVKLELRSEVKDEVKNDLRQEVWQDAKDHLRSEVWDEVKTELRQEISDEVHENIKREIRAECLVQAKSELRNEVEEECRQEQMQALLSELGNFLKSKHLSKKEDINNGLESGKPQVIARITENTKKVVFKPIMPKKRLSESSVDKKEEQKVEENYEGSTSVNEISSTEQAMSLMIMENELVGEAEDGTETNFFIIEANEEEEEDTTEQKRQDEANTYFAEEDSCNFQASESSKDSTTYQIESNGEIKCFKKDSALKADSGAMQESDNEQNVLIFEPDFVEDEIDDHLMEIHEVKHIKRASGDASAFITSNDESPVVIRKNDVSTDFKCPECPQLFSTENRMYRHMSMHKKLKQKGVSYQCSNCHVFFSCKSSLNRHMLKHTGNRPFTCEECGKSFIQREILKRHMLTHTGERPYECPHCERSFLQKLNLKQHIDKFHSDNPKVQHYSCHMCPKRFNHASGLSRHLTIHSGVIFQCPQCERNFTDRSSVKRHMMHMHKNIKIKQKEDN